jgi:hypothetical protein
MRIGSWRGATLAIGVATLLGAGMTESASAGLIFHTIPRETLAYDVRTGGVSYAPPIPYGEYAKDYVGCITGPVHGLIGRFCMLCGKLGCQACGGLGHHGGKACGLCGGDGCTQCQGGGHGMGHGRGLFHHGGDPNGGDPNGGGHGWSLAGLHGRKAGRGGLCGPGQNCAAAQMPVVASGQAGAMSACGLCGGRGRFAGRLCGGCGGRGWSHGGGLFHHGGDPCGACGGRGCGLCQGGLGKLCGNCGGRGCGLCQGGLGKLCGNCGGQGCRLCKGHLLGLISGALHHNDVKYFVGPGGPVPITPGYVPYVVTTRSPRDFLAFPPFLDSAMP